MISLVTIAMLANAAAVSVEDLVKTCAAVPSAEARLDCYDGIAAAMTPPATKAAAVEPVSPPAPEPTAAPAPAAAEEPARFVIYRADDPKVKAIEKSNGLFSGFFSREPYDATVVAARRNNMGYLFIELDTGEIWRETRVKADKVPAAGSAVRLEPGSTGGWFAKFADTGEMVKVRRHAVDDGE